MCPISTPSSPPEEGFISASRQYGRIGGVLVAFGVGAALLATGPPAAWADEDSIAGPGTSPSGSAAAGGSETPRASSAARRAGEEPKRAGENRSRSIPAGAAAVRVPVLQTGEGRVMRVAAPARTDDRAMAAVGGQSAAKVAMALTPLTSPVPPALSSMTIAQSSVTNPSAMPPKQSFIAALTASLVTVGSFAMSVSRELSVAFYRGPTASLVNQSLVLSGYNLVPSSTEIVTAFYGRWSYLPGGPTYFQGQQQYELVDPATGQTQGTFDALVTSGSPLFLRDRYVELLVISNDGVNVGTAAGQVPPVGSLISTQRLFGRFGWSYSAMPSPSGGVVSCALLTPFGEIPLPVTFDAAEGIADHTLDDRPINLGNGYSIAPADPAGETVTAVSGLLPIFTTTQGHQVFSVFDSDGNAVGSFEGVYTPTSDIFGTFTKAILVTSAEGSNVGTNPGQVPPAGSVYNIIYLATDDIYVLYSSLPSQSGDVVSVISSVGGKVSNIGTWPLTRLNASAAPPVRRLTTSVGYSFLPISPLVVSGVNGLPPREIQTQGYQQFGVYDSDGVEQGSFDATVFNQWDLLGGYSTAILVTGVTDGTVGTGPGDVPPVGSMFNYVYFGNTGFGSYYAVMPSPSGDVIRLRIMTPIFDIPLRTTYNAVSGLDTVNLYDPFI